MPIRLKDVANIYVGSDRVDSILINYGFVWILLGFYGWAVFEFWVSGVSDFDRVQISWVGYIFGVDSFGFGFWDWDGLMVVRFGSFDLCRDSHFWFWFMDINNFNFLCKSWCWLNDWDRTIWYPSDTPISVSYYCCNKISWWNYD